MDTRFADLLKPFLRFLGDRPLTEDAELRPLGLDSMQAIEVLFEIEDVFGITLPDELMTDATFETAGSLWSAVHTCLEPGAVGAGA